MSSLSLFLSKINKSKATVTKSYFIIKPISWDTKVASINKRNERRQSGNTMPKIVILFGVSGCGKTSVGQSLAQRLGCRFLDADDYHSKENVEKMSRGIPLNDEDRFPWLLTLHRVLVER